MEELNFSSFRIIIDLLNSVVPHQFEFYTWTFHTTVDVMCVTSIRFSIIIYVFQISDAVIMVVLIVHIYAESRVQCILSPSIMRITYFGGSEWVLPICKTSQSNVIYGRRSRTSLMCRSNIEQPL